MKRYRFTLEAVRRLRRIEEERAREALQLANARLRSLVVARDAESARYLEMASRPLATSPVELDAERLALGLIVESVACAERAVIEQAMQTAQAQLVFRAAERRVEALDRLDARQREAHEIEAQRAEGLVLDDLVTAQYVRDRARLAPEDAHV